MLDPLSALSLAAALVQFIDFTGTVVSNAHQMHKAATGSSKANFDIEKLVSTLQGLIVDLAPSSTSTLAGLPPNAQKLYAIAAECRKLSEEIIVFLQELRISSQGRSRAFVAIRQSIRATFKADKTEAMMKTLDRLQIELNAALLLVVRDDQSTAMAHLQSLSRRAEALSVGAASQLDATRAELLAALERQNTELQRMSTKLDQNHVALLRTCADTQESVRLLASRLNDVVNIGDSTDRSTRVLASLRFNGIFDRQSSIHTNHEGTCHWIFDSHRVPFAQWCKTGSGVFWISGKAGSGKSTLMRFLKEDARTTQILQRGTVAKHVVIASYYFWSAGTELQRSQTGLLQSLLFQMLSSCPNLIPIVCPQRWVSPGNFMNLDRPWEHEELRQALHALANTPRLDTEFCFLIDGLDEYAGDHHNLITDLSEMAASPYIRLCVSSRPWNAFRNAYGAGAASHIVLEAHTHADIEQYVKGTLIEDPRFVDLVRRYGSAQSLITEIRERSEGVFLWIFLVIRSLLRGLTEQDDIEILRSRLQELPSELERLFGQILDSVDGVYKKHQAQTLLLVMHSVSPLPALAVWHLQREIEQPGSACSALDCGTSVTRRRLVVILNGARMRVNSWCRDLLEVQDASRPIIVITRERAVEQERLYPGNIDITGTYINTLHRTVRDYLALEDVQQRLRTQAGDDFDCLVTLCHLGLAQLRCLDRKLCSGWGDLEFKRICATIMRQARNLEQQGRLCPLDVLRRLDELATCFLGPHFFSPHWAAQMYEGWGGYWTIENAITKSTQISEKKPVNIDFMAYTLSHGIKAYLQARLEQEPDFLRETTVPYLYYALPQYSPHFRSAQPSAHVEESNVYFDLLRYMLNHGASPDTIVTQRRFNSFQRKTILRAYLDDTGDEEGRESEDFFAMIQAEALTITRRPIGANTLVPNINRDAAFWKTFVWSTGLPPWGRAPVMHLKRLISPW
ncbi:hypothetical protein LTR56_002170 [Elasticomyces elasticus]|nr:hypothetical protein LTR56_002170 [Elasticomyces elasticus]KAK3666049.1 hypothetical protein LTR22_003052 [Elasticomyces elasticus]KAK4929536.1 hypothetical protein LTR49_003831 [Elasticomyces elasticus]KAK5767506.1 hypothetical protein LTS12_002347 [Elasticomyces elasticus]